MNLLNTALIRLSLVLLAGTLAGSFYPLPLSWLLFLLAGLLLAFFIAYFRSHKLLLQDRIFGSCALLLFFALGLLNTRLHQPENRPSHYMHQLSPEAKDIMGVKILEELKSNRYQNRYLAKVQQVNGLRTQGKILLLLSLEQSVFPGDKLLLASEPDSILAPLNPQQFNYRSFMANKGILFQTAPGPLEFRILREKEADSFLAPQQFREQIINSLRQHSFGSDQLALMQALLLGQRRELSAETTENFAAAGVVHILAVSGLHVGIILLLLHRLLRFLDSRKWRKFFKTLLLILLLWGYALLAGFSPSIVRAVCMFSFVAVGMQLSRQTSVLNSLSLSLLLLLLLRPQWVREVGFQLSYLAVFSIVILQPLIYSWCRPKNVILDYFWKLLSVTTAAQVGVMPLSLYYFHQFPGLFFVANLVILPFLGLLLGFGLLIILLSLLDQLPLFLIQAYDYLLELLSDFVEWVALREAFLFRDIPFSLPQLLAIYALLLALLHLTKGFSAKKLKVLLVTLLCVQGAYIYEEVRMNTSELVIFHKSRSSILGLKQQRNLILYHDPGLPLEEQALVRNYKLLNAIHSTDSAELGNVYTWNEELLLKIDSSGIYQIPGLQPDRILLTGSPQINLERLLRELQPKQIIADGSNYPNLVRRWRESCRDLNIPFHHTGEEGAYVWK